jgi:hypothetical protein
VWSGPESSFRRSDCCRGQMRRNEDLNSGPEAILPERDRGQQPADNDDDMGTPTHRDGPEQNATANQVNGRVFSVSECRSHVCEGLFMLFGRTHACVCTPARSNCCDKHFEWKRKSKLQETCKLFAIVTSFNDRVFSVLLFEPATTTTTTVACVAAV